MGLFVLHAEGKAAECSVGVGRGREGGERQWGRVKVEIAAMTLCETRSAVHPDVSKSARWVLEDLFSKTMGHWCKTCLPWRKESWLVVVEMT